MKGPKSTVMEVVNMDLECQIRPYRHLRDTHRPTVGSWESAPPYERGTPATLWGELTTVNG
jgi:hypothetical protein